MKVPSNVNAAPLHDRLFVMMLQSAQPNTSFLSRGRKTRKVHKTMNYINVITLLCLLAIVIKMGFQAWYYKQM